MNEIILATRWTIVDQTNQPDITTPAGCAWEDLTGQPAENLPCAPNLYLIRARVTDPVLSTIQASPKYLILARQTTDLAGEITYSNTEEQPSAAQLLALKDKILSQYPDMDEDKLTEAGKAILEAGLTRIEIITKLIARWKRFQHA